MNGRSDLAQQAILVQRLQAMLGGTQACQLHETHISWVLVAAGYAYKIKKALKFDVLDYGTLRARHRCCEEEVRLNGRMAPGLYLDVVAITTGGGRPRLDGDGPVIEYAVRMRAFPQQALWSERLSAGQLGEDEIDAFAARLAACHGTAAVAPDTAAWGGASLIERMGSEDLASVEHLAGEADMGAQTHLLAVWRSAQQAVLERIALRKTQGQVRECHGDLHCGNILTLDGQVQAFDCIEFNDSLRWIDVMDDLAFTLMDLRFHGRQDLAARLLERYLEASGDYSGLAVLGYYEIMRAVVRAKVCLLRAASAPAGSPEAAAERALAQRYLAFATASARPGQAALIITCGCSGSGKSYYSGLLARALDGIRFRSDVERKRLHGLAPAARMAAAPGAGIYSDDSTRVTYARLMELTRYALHAGMRVVIDASFLQRWQREPFARLAAEMRSSFHILELRADVATLRARLARRVREGRDASDAGPELLARQSAARQPLSSWERRHAWVVDTTSPQAQQAVAALADAVRVAQAD